MVSKVMKHQVPNGDRAGRYAENGHSKSHPTDVDDWTSPLEFFFNSTVLFILIVEKNVSLFCSTVVFIALRFFGVGIYLFLYPVAFAVGALVTFVRYLCNEGWNPHQLYSVVNFGAVTYMKNYRRPSVVDAELAQPKPDVGKDAAFEDKLGDPQLAHFFSMLTSAVYESNWFHNELFATWGFDMTKVVRVINKNSCSCTIAWQTIQGKRVVIVVFKGTSPFNLNEWMSDATIDKVSDRAFLNEFGYTLCGDTPAGEVHEGFLNSFLRKPQRDCETPISQILEVLKRATDGAKEEDVRLWVTGHSLGAALAEVFASFVVCRGGAPDTSNPDCIWGKLMASLSGVCTFGNPRTVDRKAAAVFETQLARQGVPYRRFRNGNDVVGVIPFGTGLLAELWEHVCAVYAPHWLPQIKLSSITDWGEVGFGFRVRQSGQMMILEEPIPYVTELAEIKNPWFPLKRVMLRVRHYSSGLWESWVNLLLSVWKLVNALVHAIWMLALLGWNLFVATRNKDGPFDLIIGTISAFVEYFTMLLMPTLVYDHIPTEYAKNIELYARSKPSPH